MLTKTNVSERQYATLVTSKLRNALSCAIMFASVWMCIRANCSCELLALTVRTN